MTDLIQKKLSNGIRVFYYADKSLKRVYASISVDYGSDGFYDNFIYNNKKYHTKPAMAHFLEHYLIENSRLGNMLHRYSEKSYISNGLTDTDVTTYYFVGIDSKKNIYTSIHELLDMIEKPVFTKENIDKTKYSICEELTGTKDDRYQIAFSNNRHNLHTAYDPVPVANNVLGTIDTTMSITLEDAKACYDAYYNDESKFIVIAGNININKVHALLESYYKKIGHHTNLIKSYPYPEDIGVRHKLEIIEMPADADIVYNSFKFPIDEKNSLFEQAFYLQTYMKIKLGNSKQEIEALKVNKFISGTIGFTNGYFKGMTDVVVYYESYKSKSSVKKIEEILNNKKYSKKEFELHKKDAIVNDIKERDFVYSAFIYFPFKLAFSNKIDNIKDYNSFTYEKYKKFISKIDFKFETTTIVTKKRIRK